MKQLSRHTPIKKVRCLLIDLDDTLYPRESGAWGRVGARIDQYLVEEMGFPHKDVPELRSRLFHQYGTTLRGLQIEYEVDMDHYLDYVHDVPLDDILSPDVELNQVLQSLPQRKVIFTNANTSHATRVLQQLGVQSQFERVIDIYDLFPFCKPQVEAFQKALDIIGEQPRRCLMVDDNLKNLATAQSLGMITVSVGAHRHDGSPHLPDIKALGRLLLNR